MAAREVSRPVRKGSGEPMVTFNLVSPARAGVLPAEWSLRPDGGPATRETNTRVKSNGRTDVTEISNESATAHDVISPERIAALRERIASGAYLTPEKIDVVTDRLHEELFGRV